MKKKICFIVGIIFIIACIVAVSIFILRASNNESIEADFEQGNNKSIEDNIKQKNNYNNLYTIEDVMKNDINYNINENTQGKAEDGIYSKLFNKEKIQDVNITIDERNWAYLIDKAEIKPIVLATSVSIGDETIKYAGIKTKGNSTLSAVKIRKGERYSFTLNFGKYVNKNNGYSEKQNFYGLQKVALNNMYGDATLMKEYLSYELMSQMGIDTPEYALVKLYINDEFYGVYMMVESIDTSLIKRTIGEDGDFLVKPEVPNGDLVYNSSLDVYINEEGEFDFSSVLYDENGNITYPRNKAKFLNKYTGLWENDEETFEEVVDMLPIVFKWMKVLNELSDTENPNTIEYKQKLESIINVDKLIRYFAANVYMVNVDSYLSYRPQNYALYINESGKAYIYPWDYNLSFGAFMGMEQDVVNFEIFNPLLQQIPTNLEERPLLNVILQNDSYKKIYEEYLKDACIIANQGGTTSDDKTYSKNNFKNILEDYRKELKVLYAKDPTAFYTIEEYEKATDEFIDFLSLRTKAVLRQLEGNNKKVKQKEYEFLWDIRL